MPKKKSLNTLRESKKKKTARKPKKDPRLEEIYEDTVYFNCPVRGRVAQKVKIKRYKPFLKNGLEKQTVDSKDLIDKLEAEDDGLSLFAEDEPDKGSTQ